MKKYPDGWNLTIRDVISRSSGATGQELEWARAYERDQLPPGTRYPVHDDVFEVIAPMRTTYLVQYDAPITTSGECELPVGMRLRIDNEVGVAQPLAVTATPIESPQFLEAIVPADVRSQPKFAGVRLSVSTRDLNAKCRLVPQ